MNIMLIQPPKASTIGGEDFQFNEPLALEYVAAGVDKRHEIRILDMNLDHDLRGNLETFKPQVVGITGYTTHVNIVKKLFKEIKTWNPEILTVAGGHHATVCPHDFQVEDIDVIVIGEGIFAFQDIISKFEKGKQYLFESLKKEDGDKVFVYKAEKVNDPDAYPFPRRDLTKNYRKHYFSLWMKPLATMITSQGCPFKCEFCVLWKLNGGQYLCRKPESIVDELEKIEEKYVFFADSESMADAKRMEKLAYLIKERGIKKKFYLYSRSDTLVKAPKLFELWKEIGLEVVFVGFEFFRDKDLDDTKKGATVKDNEAAMKILNKLGIRTIASFIVRPEFDREDFKAFTKYCLDIKSKYNIQTIRISILTPLPGTDLYEKTKSQLISDKFEYFDINHLLIPSKLPLKEFYEEYSNLFGKLYKANDLLFMLKKYSLKEIVRIVTNFNKMVSHLKKLYKEY